MGREAQNLVLLCLGITVAKVVLDGSYERYVKPGMWPYLLVSSAVLIVLAVFAIGADVSRGGPPPHDHAHGRSRVLWLLTVPVLVVLFLAPPALAPARSGTTANVSAADSGELPPLPAGPAPTVGIFDVVQRAISPGGGGLSGRPITLQGFLQPRDGRPELAQVVIICCAADARTYRIELSGPKAQELLTEQPKTWWRMVGTVVDGSTTVARKNVPLFDVTSADEVPAPKNPYGY
ncbi:MAG: TIGR03943 family protein [Gordonia sp. (in: high G+C Gram-positive bacteria)]|uniref:TIGR03943 family putative permease subunit n=1 Tax=Gordonia sp. (in: high G+C Gram-positive bacteria) TaxID=84139 RepID=UPI0039E651E3